MGLPATKELFKNLESRDAVDDYNFEHFRTKHLLADAWATVSNRGIRPGQLAPDFELAQVGGPTVRLSDLRGKPVLLHFGSIT